MRYPTLLFDLDHTLLDSDESERLAYEHTMANIGLADPGAYFDRYVAINRAMWSAVEVGEMQPSDVRHRRFERFTSELGIDADPDRMAEAFVWGLGNFGELYDGARTMLESLANGAVLAMVTNGLSEVQRARIARLGLDRYFHTVVISSEVGATKPRPEIFDLAFEGLGSPDRSTALMIGDSLTSDIAGGHRYGVDTCWYNRHGADRPGSSVITHEIADLGALVDIVMGSARS